jgi:hypothetical protein
MNISLADLMLVTTLDWTPYAFELLPVNADEREATDEILDTLPPVDQVRSSKGFIGTERQADEARQGAHVWITKWEAQEVQKASEFDRLLNSVREDVEGAFHLFKEGGRSVEHTLALTAEGLCTRIITKATCGAFRLSLRRFFGIDVPFWHTRWTNEISHQT